MATNCIDVGQFEYSRYRELARLVKKIDHLGKRFAPIFASDVGLDDARMVRTQNSKYVVHVGLHDVISSAIEYVN